jgi:hypothetical protein
MFSIGYAFLGIYWLFVVAGKLSRRVFADHNHPNGSGADKIYCGLGKAGCQRS